MKDLGILAAILLGLSIPAAAQTSASSQTSTSVQSGPNSSASAGTSSSASTTRNSANIASGTAIQAELVTPLDAKHNKPGDAVVARTTQDVKRDGKVIVKRGTRLTGHVTQAEARSKSNAQSSLGIVFDHAVMKGGQQMPLNLSVMALAAAANQTSAALADDRAAIDSASQAGFAGSSAASTPTGGGLVRGAGNTVGTVGNTVGGATNTAGNVAGNVGHAANGTVGAATQTVASAGSTGGLNAAGQLMSNSTGVFNLQGLNLTSAASSGTSASVVNSTSRNVHLDSGTQMLLQVVHQ